MECFLAIRDLFRYGTRILLVFIGLAFMPVTANASPSFLCGATQSSDRQLAVLNKTCPIGKGMWGKKSPASAHSYFWIQCGMLETAMPLDVAKVLYQHISTDVWMKAERSGYRCLIGPYKSYKQVKLELEQVKKISRYRDAFIREVTENTHVSRAPAKQKSIKQHSNSRFSSYDEAVSSSRKKALLRQAMTEKNDLPEIRLQTQIAGTMYQIPYLGQETQQYYMEHDRPWTRVNYATADKVCHQLGMRLPSEGEWNQLLHSKEMDSGFWPVYLPYWGADKKGLFTSGKINQLQGNSLLNVVCVSQDVRALASRSP